MDVKKESLLEFIKRSNKKQIVIPIYQRKYVWTKEKEIKQLMKDLNSLIENGDCKPEKEHFLGIIIYFDNEKEFSIIDGQQRIITMFLILCALKSIAEEKKLFIIIREIQEYIQCDGGHQRLLLLDKSCEKIIFDLFDEKNVDSRFSYLKFKLKKIIESNEKNSDVMLYSLYLSLKKFLIVSISVKNKTSAQQIFESINSTGKTLTASDLIKNFILMGKLNDAQTKLFKKIWTSLEKIFDNSEKMEIFFRHYLASVLKEYCSIKDLYESFKIYWNKNAKKDEDVETLLTKIERYANHFKSIYCNESKKSLKSKKYKEILSDFQDLEIKMSAPFVLGIRELHKNNEEKFSEEQYFDVLQVVNTYQIRRHFCEKNTMNVHKSFPNFLKAVEFYVEKYGYEDIVDIVKYVLITKNQNNKMSLPSDDQLKNDILNMNAYTFKKTRWLLEKRENKYSNNPINKNELSVDHFMPQTPTQYWEKRAGKTGQDYKKLVNSIGNLFLASKIDNSKASNKDFESKKAIFLSSGHMLAYDEFRFLDDWTFQNIQNLSEKIFQFFIEMYPYISSKKIMTI